MACVVAVSPMTHRTIPASTFPNWYFMLHCLPQNKENLNSLRREVFHILGQGEVFLVDPPSE